MQGIVSKSKARHIAGKKWPFIPHQSRHDIYARITAHIHRALLRPISASSDDRLNNFIGVNCFRVYASPCGAWISARSKSVVWIKKLNRSTRKRFLSPGRSQEKPWKTGCTLIVFIYLPTEGHTMGHVTRWFMWHVMSCDQAVHTRLYSL